MNSVYLDSNPNYHVVLFPDGSKAKIMQHEYDGRVFWYIDEFDQFGDVTSCYEI